MKNIFFVLIIIGALISSCEPALTERPDIGTPPSESQMNFTISPGADDFHVVLENTSSVAGIASWDLGNGVKATGNKIIAKYSLAGTYTITLNLATKGGIGSLSKEYNQSSTDYSIFNDPVYLYISGGINNSSGKTWVIDSLEWGHFGVSAADANWPVWWGANPLQKSGGGCYDDKFNFNINEFVFNYINNGNSYVKNEIANDPLYSNPVPVDGADLRVSYTPEIGSWSINEKDGMEYLILNGTTPLFFGFNTGAVNNEFRIDSINENILKLSCIAFDGNRWYYQLIPDGYVKPQLEYNLSVNPTANPNEYLIALTNVNVPNNWTITNIAYDFGDGTNAQTVDTAQTFTHTYMRKGSYTIEVIVTANNENFSRSTTITVLNNHPSYVQYLLNAMVMYNDFGETTIVPLAFEGNGSIQTVVNPDKSIWPNRSNHCGFYTKNNDQWGNAYMLLPAGYRFDLTLQSKFRLLVYGTAGEVVLLKLENTDKGANAWQTGTHDVTYTIQKSNTWEIAEFNFAGVGAGWNWTGDIFTSDVTTDSNFNKDFYNVVRIMYQPGDGSQVYTFYLDDLAGPHVEGLK